MELIIREGMLVECWTQGCVRKNQPTLAPSWVLKSEQNQKIEHKTSNWMSIDDSGLWVELAMIGHFPLAK